MTYTYNLTTPDDITRVRFHTADTVEDYALWSDEEIQFVIDEEGTYQKAVVALLSNLVLKLSMDPDFQADWLRVDLGRSVEGVKAMLSQKRSSFGLATPVAGVRHVYRIDSLQKETPDWEEDS